MQVHFFEHVCIPRLSDLIESSGTLSDTLRILSSIHANKPMYSFLEKIRVRYVAGASYAESVKKEASGVSDMVIKMIALGERNGALPRVLVLLAGYIEEKERLKNTIIMACVYPLILTLAMFGIIGFLVFYIFPKMLPVMLGMHIKLPLLTRILIWTVTFLKIWWSWVLIGLLTVFVIGYMCSRKPRVRSQLQSFIMSVKPLQRMIALSQTATLFRALGIFLETDSRLQEALVLVATISSYDIYVRELTASAKIVAEGRTLTSALASMPKFFTPEAYEFVTIGEQRGTLAKMCEKSARAAAAELDGRIQTLLKIAEPVLLLAMGSAVAAIALSFMLPLYSITDSLGK